MRVMAHVVSPVLALVTGGGPSRPRGRIPGGRGRGALVAREGVGRDVG
jgi:hypothetical protein